jgi:pimeloyl-ACP methyl ester carboxylesterase
MTQIIFHHYGSGPPLLMLHAFPLNAKMWDNQIEALSRFSSIWAPDYPGFGASAQAATFESLDDLAVELHQALRDRGVGRASVAGCSIGGYLAFGLLRVAPQLCERLVLINTKPTADSPEARSKRLALAQRVDKEGCAFLADEWHLGALSNATLETRPSVVERVRSLVHEATPNGVAAAQRAMAARPDSSQLLGAIDFPTLVIHGLDDTYVAEAEAHAMADEIKGTRFVGIKDAGHLPNMERPEIVTSELQQFLSANA